MKKWIAMKMSDVQKYQDALYADGTWIDGILYVDDCAVKADANCPTSARPRLPPARIWQR
ncbi:MAG: hypothetical protein Q4F00_08835 [bacterium]|nr:hypothetical protein [bacterium]